jgi:tetratricopeptide (TPR) repeat protein
MKQERQANQLFERGIPKSAIAFGMPALDRSDSNNLSAELIELPDQVIPQQLDAYVAWFQRGETLANLGLYREALESFEQATILHPKAAEAWIFQGVMHLHLNQPEAALACCDRALAIAPTNREAWIFRGVALNRLGHCKLAYVSFGQAIDLPQQRWWQKVLSWFISF